MSNWHDPAVNVALRADLDHSCPPRVFSTRLLPLTGQALLIKLQETEVSFFPRADFQDLSDEH